MPTVFTKDTLRASVEAASGGKVTVLYDDKGYPSYMNVIPKFKVEDIDASLGTGVHPAFIVGGVEKSEIFIGQYSAHVRDNRAVSLPGLDPTASLTFDQAKTYCKNKGQGWHLMTNWEWAAIALWSLKNGFQPRGNTAYGKSHEAGYETAVRQDRGVPGDTTGTARNLTGSGPASWRHDNTYAGIADLVGNVWEWNDGLKIVDGKIYMPADNNYALDEAQWNNTGIVIDALGVLNTTKTGDYSSSLAWKSVTAKAGVTVPTSLKQALITPSFDTTNPKGNLYANNTGERLPFRGGGWASGANAGLFALHLGPERSNAGANIGFRPAYIG